ILKVLLVNVPVESHPRKDPVDVTQRVVLQVLEGGIGLAVFEEVLEVAPRQRVVLLEGVAHQGLFIRTLRVLAKLKLLLEFAQITPTAARSRSSLAPFGLDLLLCGKLLLDVLEPTSLVRLATIAVAHKCRLDHLSRDLQLELLVWLLAQGTLLANGDLDIEAD